MNWYIIWCGDPAGLCTGVFKLLIEEEVAQVWAQKNQLDIVTLSEEN